MSQDKIFKVMFVCTGNSCRSQMAEGFARELGKGLIEAYSGGLTPCYVHPVAIKVMYEKGIDISGQRSKAIDSRLLGEMDFVVTLCNHADKYCPPVPARIKRVHMPVKDPVGTVGSENEILGAFRKTRDEVRDKILSIVEDLQSIRLIMYRHHR